MGMCQAGESSPPRVTIRRDPPYKVAVTRRLPAVLAVLAVLLAAAGGSMAWADHKASSRLASGISVAGVDVGGMSEDAAVASLEQELGTAARRSLRV